MCVGGGYMMESEYDVSSKMCVRMCAFVGRSVQCYVTGVLLCVDGPACT